MKSRILISISAITLLLSLAIPLRLAAQETASTPKSLPSTLRAQA